MSDDLLRRVKHKCFKGALREGHRLAFCYAADMPRIEARIERYNRIHAKVMRRLLSLPTA